MNPVFWNVDTQRDFMLKHGKLYVPGAEEILPNLQKLTQFAQAENFFVVNTADSHVENSAELSDTPDFKETFPPHCMRGSLGAEFVPETMPDLFDTMYLLWDFPGYNIVNEQQVNGKGLSRRNIVIFKDAFDVFTGNPHTDRFVRDLKTERVVVYGVATNVCVHYAVMGLLERGYKVIVIDDAIKGLTTIPLSGILFKWEEQAGFDGYMTTEVALKTF